MIGLIIAAPFVIGAFLVAGVLSVIQDADRKAKREKWRRENSTSYPRDGG